MKTYQKHYIGKGKQVANFDIVKVVIPFENIEAACFEKEGVKYFSFEIARMKEADKYGRTHACYYTMLEEAEAPEEPKSSKKKSSKKKEQEMEEDLPF